MNGSWIHICCDKLFDEFHRMKQPMEVTLGDGYAVEATGCGTVVLELTSVGGKATRCKLHEFLYMPDLSHNRLRITKAEKWLSVLRLGVKYWTRRR